MATVQLVFALIGAIIPPIAIGAALFSREKDRFAEGILVGVYLGTLGSISVIAILGYFGWLPVF